MTSTVKVYEIADDLKMDTETVLHKIRALGIDVKNKMSKIDANYVDQIKSSLAKDKQASFIEVEVAPGVMKRKRVDVPPPPPLPLVHPPAGVRPAARVHTTDVAARAPMAPIAAPEQHDDRVVSREADRPLMETNGGGHAAVREDHARTHEASTPVEAARAESQDIPVGPPASLLVSPPVSSETEPGVARTATRPDAHAARTATRPDAHAARTATRPDAHAARTATRPDAHAARPSEAVSEGEVGHVEPGESKPVPRAETTASDARPEPGPESTVASTSSEIRHEPKAEPAVTVVNPEIPSERPVPVTLETSAESRPSESRPLESRPLESRSGEGQPESVTAVEATDDGRIAETVVAPGGAAGAARTAGAQTPAGDVAQTAGVGPQGAPVLPLTGAGARSQPPGPRTGIAVWNPQTRLVEHHESPGSRGSGGGASTRPGGSGSGSGGTLAPAAPKSTLPSRRVVQVPPAPARGPGRPGALRGPMGRPGTTQGAGPRAIPAMRSTSKPVSPSPEMAKHKRVIRIEEQISLQELARRMSLKATDVLMKLLQLGGGGKNINSTLDSDTAKLLASEFGYEVEDVALDVDGIIKASLPPYEEKPEDIAPRSPVVTVMGHVDHGKTTLLDAILGMRVAEGEAGGITQEVRAYRVSTAKGPVVFFDTPGHEAFTALRMRGAQATDVAVLVVAADDGVMPTTVEAINHAKAARVPIVVALNKMDRPDANPDKVLQQLMQYDVIPEEFGGETLVVRVSAKAKTGIEQLLESLALQTDLLDLRANAKKPGVGTVFEAKLDKGRGAVARVLVQEGIVRNGDVVMAGSAFGRIRAMVDDRGRPIEKAGPSVPVEIQGLNKVPTAGDKLYVVADMRKAQEVAEQLQKLQKVPQADVKSGVNLTDILNAQRGDRQININVVIKADAQGAVEGLRKALTELSTDKVKVTVIHSAVGAITETDVQLASASGAVILGFNVRPAGKAGPVADEAKVEIRYYNVIYEAVDDIKALMTGQLKPTLVEKPLGKAEVRQVFNITKTGTIAGCMVTDGLIRRTARARLVRDGAIKWDGKLASLRRFKEDAKEVSTNFECGIGLENYADLKPGDVIEAYDVEEVAAQL